MEYLSKNQIKKFESFLMKAGAMVVPVTNEWELTRFKCDKGIGIIYENKKGNQTFTGIAQEAFSAFTAKMPWSAIDKHKRTQRTMVMEELLRRDGGLCFFCSGEFDENDPERRATLEHLLPISAGGNNHIHNLVLAHSACNFRAADMALIDKIKLRESLHQKNA